MEASQSVSQPASQPASQSVSQSKLDLTKFTKHGEREKQTNHAAKNWVFTDVTDLSPFGELPSGVKYTISQVEKAPTTGKLHRQGYVQLTVRKRLSFLSTLRPHAYWSRARGSCQQNQIYCSKADTRHEDGAPEELGTPITKGQRTDLEAFYQDIKSGQYSKSEIFDLHPGQMIRHRHAYDDIRALTKKPTNPDKQVYLLYGPTGLGKTRLVHEACKDEGLWEPYIGNAKWFDGYDQEPNVLLDDFDGALSHYSLKTTLKLLDIYRTRVEIKGGGLHFQPDTIYITTNIHPQNWYKWEGREAQRPALFRRFTAVLDFTSPTDDKPYTVHMGVNASMRWFGYVKCNGQWLTIEDAALQRSTKRKSPESLSPVYASLYDEDRGGLAKKQKKLRRPGSK